MCFKTGFLSLVVSKNSTYYTSQMARKIVYLKEVVERWPKGGVKVAVGLKGSWMFDIEQPPGSAPEICLAAWGGCTRMGSSAPPPPAEGREIFFEGVFFFIP